MFFYKDLARKLLFCIVLLSSAGHLSAQNKVEQALEILSQKYPQERYTCIIKRVTPGENIKCLVFEGYNRLLLPPIYPRALQQQKRRSTESMFRFLTAKTGLCAPGLLPEGSITAEATRSGCFYEGSVCIRSGCIYNLTAEAGKDSWRMDAAGFQEVI